MQKQYWILHWRPLRLPKLEKNKRQQNNLTPPQPQHQQHLPPPLHYLQAQHPPARERSQQETNHNGNGQQWGQHKASPTQEEQLVKLKDTPQRTTHRSGKGWGPRDRGQCNREVITELPQKGLNMVEVPSQSNLVSIELIEDAGKLREHSLKGLKDRHIVGNLLQARCQTFNLFCESLNIPWRVECRKRGPLHHMGFTEQQAFSQNSRGSDNGGTGLHTLCTLSLTWDHTWTKNIIQRGSTTRKNVIQL